MIGGNFRVEVPESWLYEETVISINTYHYNESNIRLQANCSNWGSDLGVFLAPAEPHVSNTDILISMTGKGSCGLQ